MNFVLTLLVGLVLGSYLTYTHPNTSKDMWTKAGAVVLNDTVPKK